jgi:hypothetical protein
MEKKKSLLEDEKFKKKLAKLSPYRRMTVEQRIKENEKWARKWQREEERLMRMPKEERLKALYTRYIGLAVFFAKNIGLLIGRGDMKERTGEATKDLKTRLKFELTMALKKANVLPLEG